MFRSRDEGGGGEGEDSTMRWYSSSKQCQSFHMRADTFAMEVAGKMMMVSRTQASNPAYHCHTKLIVKAFQLIPPDYLRRRKGLAKQLSSAMTGHSVPRPHVAQPNAALGNMFIVVVFILHHPL